MPESLQLDLFAEPKGKRRLTNVFKGKPLHDLRGAHHHDLAVSGTMPAKRQQVFDALVSFGPATCRELAFKMCWEVTSVRPRMTELVRDGKAKTTGARRDGEYEFSAV